MGQSRPLFVYFRSFRIIISIQIEKSIDGVLGIRTRGRRMVGADETTELWRPPPLWQSGAGVSSTQYLMLFRLIMIGLLPLNIKIKTPFQHHTKYQDITELRCNRVRTLIQHNILEPLSR